MPSFNSVLPWTSNHSNRGKGWCPSTFQSCDFSTARVSAAKNEEGTFDSKEGILDLKKSFGKPMMLMGRQSQGNSCCAIGEQFWHFILWSGAKYYTKPRTIFLWFKIEWWDFVDINMQWRASACSEELVPMLCPLSLHCLGIMWSLLPYFNGQARALWQMLN